MIHHGRGVPASGAIGVAAQEHFALVLPVGRIAALAGAGAGRIVAAISGAGAFDLTGTARAMGHGLATGTDMGRSRHCARLSGREGPCGQSQGQARRHGSPLAVPC